MGRLRRLLLGAVLAALLAPALVAVEPAAAQAAPDIVVQDGVTQPVFSYAEAVRETVYVEVGTDTDRDGVLDRTAIDIIRPAETEEGLRVPIIMDPSPYYSTLGRGNEAQLKGPDDGTPELFPLVYDNYFVPRGYAVALQDMTGTRAATGCVDIGAEEVESTRAAVAWLAGDGTAVDRDGAPVDADWSNGRVSLIGKSYDGTLANAVAATGVEGLATIVPITAISSWVDYYWNNGVGYAGGPAGLHRAVSGRAPGVCAVTIAELTAGGANPDPGTDFWQARDYVRDAAQIEASVFQVAGLNDYNVKPKHQSQWWDALEANDVPRKLWLTQTGHVDPFDFRRDEWLRTLHRWFDHELQDVDNGIMDEPMVDIERAADVWEQSDSFPADTARRTTLRLGPAGDGAPGTLTTRVVRGRPAQTFTTDRQRANSWVVDPAASRPNRLVYVSPVLGEDVRLSGVPTVDLQADVSAPTNLTAMVVDYGTAERVDAFGPGSGIRTTDVRTCYGQGTAEDTGCYLETEKRTVTAPFEIVTRGWLNTAFAGGGPGLRWDVYTEDYVFPAGHRIGVVLAGSDQDFTTSGPRGAQVDVTLGSSSVQLPVVGGRRALDAAFAADPPTAARQRTLATPDVPSDPLTPTVEDFR